MRSRTWLLPILTAALARLVIGCGDSGHSLGNSRGEIGGSSGSGGAGTGAGGSLPLPDGGGADLPAGAGGARSGSGGAAAGSGGNAAGAGGTGAGGGGSGGSGAGGTGTGTGGSGTGGAGGAPICSDVPSAPCPSGQICDLDTPNRCAAGFEPGHCIVPPSGCITLFDPVCGCNAMTYSNDCERQRARVQLDHTGACAQADAGTDAATGCAACNHSTEYCQITVGGVVGAPPRYACLPLPGACGASPSCACLTSVACSSVCAGSAAAGLTVTCFAP